MACRFPFLFLAGLFCAYLIPTDFIGSFSYTDTLSVSIIFFSALIIVLSIYQCLGLIVPATMAHLYKKITQGNEKGQGEDTTSLDVAVSATPYLVLNVKVLWHR